MSAPWSADPPSARDRLSYADAEPRPFWLDRDDAPEPKPPLVGGEETDLAIVGGGLSGLWAAVLAKEDDPSRDVVVCESQTVGFGASGRSGGFILSSLTHGIANGVSRFGDEIDALERLGRENLAQTAATLERYGVDCDLELTGDIAVALEPHEEAWLVEQAEALGRFGHEVELLDAEAMRAEVRSPTYRGGLWTRTSGGVVDPARLVWGLRRVALDHGVRLHEGTGVTGIARRGAGVGLRTASGEVTARRALLATSAYRPLLRRVRRRIVPVYDYVLVTEPLSAEQRDAIGWRRRQGIGDSANRFHYYRLTADDRILWGGYDAVYHFANRVAPELEDRDASFGMLASHFFTTFPQLDGLRFSHRWAGPIDTCSRFCAFYGTSHGGRVSYVAGHTGLGIGASRFGARVALDLLAGRRTEATSLRYARTRPMAFPPEPLRWAVIELTRNRLAAADRRGGRRGVWLRLLDRVGLGFDS